MARILKKSYLLVKIDTDRMTNGEEVAKRLRKGEGGGIPWMVILDGEGKALINSDGPGGNVGCPVTEEEAAWFFTMLERTNKGLTDKQLKILRREHAAFAKSIQGH
ncbi:MAG: hypothetical protein QF404_08560 [Planctomycetota bacterium]|nr:hypothetical protein [Planctomycetota bacterium]MDP6939576.1 hypothetical protein [Planctomycetota bacterium]